VGNSASAYTYIWDFGDGMLDTTENVTYDSIFYVYNSGGDFIPKLILIDQVDCQTTIVAEKPIVLSGMNLDFQADRTLFCNDQGTTMFTNLTASTHPITDLEWQFYGADPTSSTSAEPSVQYLNPGNYSVELLVSNGICMDSLLKQDYIGVGAVPEAAFQISDSIGCAPLTVNFQDQSTVDSSSITNWNWNFSNLDETDLAAPVFIFNEPGIHNITLTATSAVGCQDTITRSVEVLEIPEFSIEAPIVTITKDTSICLNDFIQLQVSGGNDLYEYQWGTEAVGLSCYDACINPIASPLVSTSFEVTVTNEHGCATTDSVRVDISNEYQDLVGEDQTICAGDQVQLNMVMGNDPVWLVTDGLDCTYCADPVAKPDSTTIYRVRALTDAGCELLDTMQIKVIPLNAIDAGADQQICQGSTATLNGSGPGTVNWTPMQSVASANTLETEVSPNMNTIYTLTLTEGSCILVDSVAVSLSSSTVLDTEDIEICEGEIIELSYEGTADQFDWYDEQGNQLDRIQVRPSETTNYTIIGQYGTCEPDTASLNIEVTPKPVSYLPEVLTYIPEIPIRIPLTILDTAMYEFEWMPADSVDCADCQQPTILPDTNTIYQVLITDLITGCTAGDTIRFEELITCPADLIGVPNAFSPNNDGNNDYLQLSPNQTIKAINRFRIFNRWGAILYETDDLYDQGWDGSVKGKLAPVGVYIFMVEFTCELTGQTVIRSGDITLFR